MRALVFIVLLASAQVCMATERFTGKVVYIDDGDGLSLLVDGKSQMKIRLSSIDAPEVAHTNHQAGRVGQPFSNAAKEFLAARAKGKQAEARCFELDRFDRSVCEVFVDGRSVNADLVQEGWAWANLAAGGRYLRDRSLLELQAAAQRAHKGLWAGGRPVPPWEWRTRCWKDGDCPN